MSALLLSPTSKRRIPRAAARPRKREHLRFLELMLPLVLLAGCAVQFVSPYDALTDEAIQQAVLKAETIFAKVTRSNASHAQVREDYRELEAMLAVVATRAAIDKKKNQFELGLVEKFREEVAELEAFHRDVGPYRASRLESTRVTIGSLLHHEKSKKAATAGGTRGGGS
jgi:hypothetical protein